jgi:WD40 repeat protein
MLNLAKNEVKESQLNPLGAKELHASFRAASPRSRTRGIVKSMHVLAQNEPIRICVQSANEQFVALSDQLKVLKVWKMNIATPFTEDCRDRWKRNKIGEIDAAPQLGRSTVAPMCLAWENASTLVAGFKSGMLTVVDYTNAHVVGQPKVRRASIGGDEANAAALGQARQINVGAKEHRVRDATDALTCCSFSPGGRFLCVGHASGRMTLCSVERGYAPTRTIHEDNTSKASMKCCCFVGGSCIAAGFFPSGRVSLAHFESTSTSEDFASTATTIFHEGGIRCCEFLRLQGMLEESGCAGHLAVGDAASSLKVYQIENDDKDTQLNKCVFHHKGSGTVVCVSYSETSWCTFLAAGKGTGEFVLYTLTGGSYSPLLVYTSGSAAEAIMTCFYSSVAEQLVLGDRSGHLRLLSMRGQSTKNHNAGGGGGVGVGGGGCGKLSRQGSLLAVQGRCHPRGDITCCAYSPQHSLFCVGTDQGSLWSYTYTNQTGTYTKQTGACINHADGGQPIKCIAFSPDGCQLSVVESARFWQGARGVLETSDNTGKVSTFQVIEGANLVYKLKPAYTFVLPEGTRNTAPVSCEYVPDVFSRQDKLLYVSFKKAFHTAPPVVFYSLENGKTTPTIIEPVFGTLKILRRGLPTSSSHFEKTTRSSIDRDVVEMPYCVTFSQDGKYAALARNERSSADPVASSITNIQVCTYIMSGRVPHFEVKASILYKHMVSCMAFSPHGNHLTVCTEEADHFSVYDVAQMPSPSRKGIWPSSMVKEHTGGVRCLRYATCKGRQYVALGGKHFQLCIVDHKQQHKSASGTDVGCYDTIRSLAEGDDCFTRSIAFSKDGTCYALAGSKQGASRASHLAFESTLRSEFDDLKWSPRELVRATAQSAEYRRSIVAELVAAPFLLNYCDCNSRSLLVELAWQPNDLLAEVFRHLLTQQGKTRHTINVVQGIIEACIHMQESNARAMALYVNAQYTQAATRHASAQRYQFILHAMPLLVHVYPDVAMEFLATLSPVGVVLPRQISFCIDPPLSPVVVCKPCGTEMAAELDAVASSLQWDGVVLLGSQGVPMEAKCLWPGLTERAWLKHLIEQPDCDRWFGSPAMVAVARAVWLKTRGRYYLHAMYNLVGGVCFAIFVIGTRDSSLAHPAIDVLERKGALVQASTAVVALADIIWLIGSIHHHARIIQSNMHRNKADTSHFDDIQRIRSRSSLSKRQSTVTSAKQVLHEVAIAAKNNCVWQGIVRLLRNRIRRNGHRQGSVKAARKSVQNSSAWKLVSAVFGHFSCTWNFLKMTRGVLVVSSLSCFYLRSSLFQPVTSVATISILMNLFYYARGSKVTGPLVRMFVQIAGDIIPLLALLAVMSAGWALAFFSLRGADREANAEGNGTITAYISTMVNVVFGQSTNMPLFREDSILSEVLLVVFMVIIQVICEWERWCFIHVTDF